MPIIRMTEGDILKSKVLETGWYKLKISKIYPAKTSKTGDSLNFPIEFTVTSGPLPGKTLDHYFNSKAPGMIAPLIEACGFKIELAADGSFDFDTDKLLHKELDGKIITDTYEGNLNNKISEFLPIGKGTMAQPF